MCWIVRVCKTNNDIKINSIRIFSTENMANTYAKGKVALDVCNEEVRLQENESVVEIILDRAW